MDLMVHMILLQNSDTPVLNASLFSLNTLPCFLLKSNDPIAKQTFITKSHRDPVLTFRFNMTASYSMIRQTFIDSNRGRAELRQEKDEIRFIHNIKDKHMSCWSSGVPLHFFAIRKYSSPCHFLTLAAAVAERTSVQTWCYHLIPDFEPSARTASASPGRIPGGQSGQWRCTW